MEGESSLYLPWDDSGELCICLTTFRLKFCFQETITMSKPYQSAVMIGGLADIYFTGAKSFVARNHDTFKKERNHKIRFEVTVSMIALVATAVLDFLDICNLC